MKIKLYLIVILLSTSALFNGCKKEGPAGPAGTDGNANVQSSTITFSTWYWDGTNGFDYSDFNWSAITSEINNTGTVLIYLSTPIGWAPLPRVIYPTSGYSQSQRYTYSTGAFKIIVQDSDLIQPANPGTWTIKVVAIASSARIANPDLDWDDYNAVKARFHLAD